MSNAAFKTLLAEFSARRAKLAERLDRANNLPETVAAVRQTLDEIQQSQIDHRTTATARRMIEQLAVLRAAVELLATANKTTVWRADPPQHAYHNKTMFDPISIKRGGVNAATRGRLRGIRTEFLKIRMMQGLICTGLLFGLFLLTSESKAAWPAIPLVLILIGLETRVWHRKHSTSAIDADTRIEVCVDVNRLLDQLGIALDIIDRNIATVDVPDYDSQSRAADTSSIESFPELLLVLQDILGEALLNDARLTLKRSRELPGVLARFGVHVRSYGGEHGTPNRLEPDDLFDTEPNLNRNATETVMLKPALVRNGKVLLRGRLVTPMDNTVDRTHSE